MPRKQKNEQQQQNTHQFNRNELLNDSKCFRAGIVKCGRISTCITFLMKSLPSRNTFSVDCLGFRGVASLTTPQPVSICGLVAHVRAAGHN